MIQRSTASVSPQLVDRSARPRHRRVVAGSSAEFLISTLTSMSPHASSTSSQGRRTTRVAMGSSGKRVMRNEQPSVGRPGARRVRRRRRPSASASANACRSVLRGGDRRASMSDHEHDVEYCRSDTSRRTRRAHRPSRRMGRTSHRPPLVSTRSSRLRLRRRAGRHLTTSALLTRRQRPDQSPPRSTTVSILASSLTLGAADVRLARRRPVPRHRPGVVLPGRHHRTCAGADRSRQGGLRRVPVGAGLPRLRARHQPGLGHLGRAHRRRAPGHPPRRVRRCTRRRRRRR